MYFRILGVLSHTLSQCELSHFRLGTFVLSHCRIVRPKLHTGCNCAELVNQRPLNIYP